MADVVLDNHGFGYGGLGVQDFVQVAQFNFG
jgi:hypothetical protein